MRRWLFGLLFLLPLKVSAEWVSLDAPVVIPSPEIGLWSGSPGSEGATIDANAEKVAFMFRYGSTNAISAIGFKTGNVTTGDDLTWRIETVTTTSGEPSGTLYCAESSGTITIAGGDDSVYKETSDLATPCSITLNGYVAIVIQRDGGTFNGTIDRKLADFDWNFAYTMNYTTSWAKDFGPALLAIKHPDGTYARFNGIVPYFALVTHTPGSGSTPNTYGNKITLPFGIRVIGALVWMDPNVDFSIRGFKGDVAVSTVAVDSTQHQATNAAPGYFLFDSTFTVDANQAFRLGITPAVASSISLYGWEAPGDSQTFFDTAFDMGPLIVQTSATNPVNEGSWTEAPTRRLILFPIIDQINIPEGGGSPSSYMFVQ